MPRARTSTATARAVSTSASSPAFGKRKKLDSVASEVLTKAELPVWRKAQDKAVRREPLTLQEKAVVAKVRRAKDQATKDAKSSKAVKN